MRRGTGQPVCGGIAVGPVRVYRAQSREQTKLPPACGDVIAEQACFSAACAVAQSQLGMLTEAARHTLGAAAAQILDVQLLMLEDVDFLTCVKEKIAQGAGAAQAVQAAGRQFADAFAAMDDEYMKARAADVCDMAGRLVDVLCGDAAIFSLPEPCVLVSEDLTPSETVQLEREKLLALVMRQGAACAHTAILARSLGIPALIQAQDLPEHGLDGHRMVVDGDAGVYIIDPNEDAMAHVETTRRTMRDKTAALERYRGISAVTRKGQRVCVLANIGGPEDVPQVMAGDAEGVGLLRSEFLYLGCENLPTEEALYKAYCAVVQGLAGKPLTIRTLDAGADKQAACLATSPPSRQEENPALGIRGVRLCLARQDVFCTQLRAIYRAAALGPVSIMLPMIASLWEVRAAKQICAEVRAQLSAEGTAFGSAAFGIMIETPAAALLSRELAAEVDFFSVGTNDLAQYTLAADRGNAQMTCFYNQRHPAVLLLLQMVAENARAQGISACVCGELAADLEMTQTLIQMGYDSLSVPPGRVLAVRKEICESEA